VAMTSCHGYCCFCYSYCYFIVMVTVVVSIFDIVTSAWFFYCYGVVLVLLVPVVDVIYLGGDVS